MNYNDLLTICFIGYDGYNDLWNDCITLFERFWSDCPFRVIFVNNELKIASAGIKVLHAGKDAEWSKKVRVALDNTTTPYICLLLEDFFVGRNVDNNVIAETLDFIIKEKMRYYKITEMNRVLQKTEPLYKGIEHIHIIPQSLEYGISLQAAIWDVSFLSDLLGQENYNAWVFEFNRVKETQEKPNIPYEGCVFDDRNILNLQHAVIQSEFLPGTIKFFEKSGIELNVQRKVMSYFKYYRIRFISLGKSILPKPLHKITKSFLELCGMKFVSTIRNS